MKIDLLVGDNLYGTTIYFAKALGEAFLELGVDTRTFWVGDDQFYHAFYEILADPPALTCSFSDISLEKRPLGDLWGIPHLSFLVDPPIYFLHQLQGKNSWASCVDQCDHEFLRALGFNRTFFLPHAADIKHLTPVEKERPYRGVFFGSCIDYKEAEKSWPVKERDLLLEAAQRVLSKEGESVIQALVELGVDQNELPRLHYELDRYIRGKDRFELLRCFDADQVRIFGHGPWEKYLPKHAVYPPVPFAQVLQIMKKSQVVFNSSPRFQAGAHERIFYALMCGAAVYSGSNPYLTEELPELFTYQYGQWQPCAFFDWQERAKAGQARVLEHHTWKNRAVTIRDRMFAP